MAKDALGAYKRSALTTPSVETNATIVIILPPMCQK
jgi:hypothetical protein